MAAIQIRSGLAFVSVVVHANGQQIEIENVLLDTGAAASVFKTDDLATIGVAPMPADPIRFMFGIGGREAVIEKPIEKLAVGKLVVSPFTIQLGAVTYGYGIAGILGMDFLLASRATIDLGTLTIT